MQRGKYKEENPFPVLFCFLFEGMKVCNSCPCYLLAVGLGHVIALRGSLMQKEQRMVWAKEQVSSFELSPAVAQTVLQPPWVRAGVEEGGCLSPSAPMGPDFLRFIVSLLIRWHSEKAGHFPGIRKAGGRILRFAEMIL